MSASDENKRDQDGDSVWRLADGRNPYLHNAFALLGIDPDAGQEEFNRQCKRVGMELAVNPQLQRFGRRVDDAEVARAERLSTQRESFAAERLLAHTVHRVNLEDFRDLLAAIDALVFPAPAELLPLPLVNLNMLAELLPTSSSRAGSPGDSPVNGLALAPLREVSRPTAEEEQIAFF